MKSEIFQVMYGFGVLNHGPAEVSRALHGEPKKKKLTKTKKKKKERPVEVRFWILKY